MHKDFGEWYRSAGMEPDGEILPKRWVGIENYSPDTNGVVSLARLFYRLGKPNDDFLAAFQDVFQKADPAFKMRDNEHELSVLAGADLVDVIERSDSALSDLAALSLVSAAAENLRPRPSVRDIPEIAARYLNERTIGRAETVDEESADIKRNKTLFAALSVLGGPHGDLVKELQRLQRELSVVTEESNMLWWLFSEYSRDERQPWTNFSVPAVALMAGKELADLTSVIPGPVAARAFLDRVIRCAKKKPPASVSIKDAINDVTIEWRQKYTSGGCPPELEDLMPISHGAKLSLASPDNDAWLPAFTPATGIKSDASIVPNILAYQIFLETLLCRSWKENA